MIKKGFCAQRLARQNEVGKAVKEMRLFLNAINRPWRRKSFASYTKSNDNSVTLHVQIIAARDLAVADLTASDPYGSLDRGGKMIMIQKA